MTRPAPLTELMVHLAAEGVPASIGALLDLAELLALEDPWPMERLRAVLAGMLATRRRHVEAIDRAVDTWLRETSWDTSAPPTPPPGPLPGADTPALEVEVDPPAPVTPEPTPTLPGSTTLAVAPGPRRFWLSTSDPAATLLPAAVVRDVWRGAGAWRSEEPSPALDIDATIERTIRAGGMPTLAWHRENEDRRVELWVDLDGGGLLARLLAAELHLALDNAEIDVRILRYWRVPETLRDAQGREVSAAQGAASRTGSQILLVTDGAALVEGALGADASAQSALRALAGWPRAALLHVGAPGRRAHVRRVLAAHGVAVAGPEDIAELLWTGGLTAAADRAVDPGPLWLWAACCAVLPVTVPDADALALRADLDLPVSAWGLPALRAASIADDGIRFSTRDRATLARRAATAWPSRPDVLDEAMDWWRNRLAQPGWKQDGTGRGQHRRALMALLDLRKEASAPAAAAELLTLSATPGFEELQADLLQLVPQEASVQALPDDARLQLQHAGLGREVQPDLDVAAGPPVLELRSRTEGTFVWLMWRLTVPAAGVDERYPPLRVDPLEVRPGWPWVVQAVEGTPPPSMLGERWRAAVASTEPGAGVHMVEHLLPDGLGAQLREHAGPDLILRTDLLGVPWEAMVIADPAPVTLGELGLVRQIPGTQGAPRLEVWAHRMWLSTLGEPAPPSNIVTKLTALGVREPSGSYKGVGSSDLLHLRLGAGWEQHIEAFLEGNWTGRRGLVVLDAPVDDAWVRHLVAAHAGAVIAPLSEPSDDSNGFQTLLYRRLLAGETLGQAMASARAATGGNAWTAYGDPRAGLTLSVENPSVPPLSDWEAGAHWVLELSSDERFGSRMIGLGLVEPERWFSLGIDHHASTLAAFFEGFLSAGRASGARAGRLTVYATGGGGEDADLGTVLSTRESAFGLGLGLPLQAWLEAVRTSGVVDEVVGFLDIPRDEAVSVQRAPSAHSGDGRGFVLWSCPRGATNTPSTAQYAEQVTSEAIDAPGSASFIDAVLSGLSGEAAEDGRITPQSLSEFVAHTLEPLLHTSGTALGPEGDWDLVAPPDVPLHQLAEGLDFQIGGTKISIRRDVPMSWADELYCSSDEEGRPGPLNRQVLTALGLDEDALRVRSNELRSRGWAHLGQGDREARCVVTVDARRPTEDALRHNFSTAWQGAPHRANIWLAPLGTGTGRLPIPRAAEIMFREIAASPPPSGHIVFTVPGSPKWLEEVEIVATGVFNPSVADPEDALFVDGWPYVDRTEVRQAIRTLRTSVGPHPLGIVLWGPRGSGRTFAAQLAVHVARETGAFEVSRIRMGGGDPRWLLETLWEHLGGSRKELDSLVKNRPAAALVGTLRKRLTDRQQGFWVILDDAMDSAEALEQIIALAEKCEGALKLIVIDDAPFDGHAAEQFISVRLDFIGRTDVHDWLIQANRERGREPSTGDLEFQLEAAFVGLEDDPAQAQRSLGKRLRSQFYESDPPRATETT